MDRIPTNNIYKIYLLDSIGNVNKVILFQGSADAPADISDSFSEMELAKIQAIQPAFVYSKQIIHKDDSIRTIKMKIIQELGLNNVAYDELYMFSKTKDRLHLLKAYLEITQQEKIEINKQMVGQFLNNLQILDLDKINYLDQHNAPNYTYNDFKKIFPNESHELFIPIGMKFTKARDLLFSANPFHILPSEEYSFSPSADNQLINFENGLLLNYGDLIDNTIYVCLTQNVIDYSVENNLDDEFILSLYYPFLYEKNINSEESLAENKQTLLAASKNLFKSNLFEKMNSVVDSFYRINYVTPQDQIRYNEVGILDFDIVLHPELPTVLPLDIIFKQIHASRVIPYIKYNPGIRREPMYRLYSTKRTKTGKKIPALSKNQIQTLSKKTGKNRQITLFIQYVIDHMIVDLFLDLHSNGNIGLRTELKHPVPIETLQQIFQDVINPIISSINTYIESSGYKIREFFSLKDTNIEILNVRYTISATGINSEIVLKDYASLLASFFDISDYNLDAGANLIFKRVENYEKMNAMAAMITRLFKQTNNQKEIVSSIMVNFELTEEEALKQIMKYLDSHTRIQGQFVNKTVDIVENPGFPIFMRFFPFENKITIDIDEITSFEFIDILRVYFDSFFKITQNVDTLPIRKGELLKMAMPITEKKLEIRPQVENVVISAKDAVQPFQLKTRMPLFETTEEEDDEDIGGILFQEEEGGDDDNDKDEDLEPQESHILSNSVFDEPVEDSESIILDQEGNAEVIGNGTAGEESEEGILFGEEDDDENNSNESGKDSKKTSLQIGGNSKLFLKRLMDKEPRLFLKKKEGMYDTYVRSCPLNYSRIPVILTDDEKKNLDEKYKGSYDVALPYGTTADKKYWYICPRYWCMTENRPLSKEQVDEGQCGGPGAVIGQDEEAGSGKTIYEFTDKKEHVDKDGKYRKHYPGFLDKETHPNPTGCLPCCFKKMNSESQITRRQECGVNDSELGGEQEIINQIARKMGKEPKKEKKQKKVSVIEPESITGNAVEKAKNNLYIVGSDKYPIPQHRWGFLPISVEHFLRTDNSTSTEKNNSALIKKNEKPILRYGVQRSANQAFVACLADVYTYYKNVPVPTIKEMREIIANAVSLDLFLKLNNGSLMTIFQPKKTNMTDIDVEKYSASDFYISFTNLSNPSQNNFLKDTISSYESFLKFLKDDDSYIDHTYLWDIVNSSEIGLFGDGLNMVIMEILTADITEDIGIICPKNSSYSKYDAKKGTILLLKYEDVYEPIYIYGNTAGGITTAGYNAIKVFNKKTVPFNLHNVLDMIEKTTQKRCKSYPSMPKVYEFKENIPAKVAYDTLTMHNFIIKNQVMNYRGKTVGIMISLREGDNNQLFVPTYPSALIGGLSKIYIDDVIWSDYVNTRDKLYSIHDKTDGEILCNPKFKVVEDGLIVGILTETNQLLQISPYEQNIIDDGIPTIEVSDYKDNGYIDADKTFASSQSQDDIRIKTVQNISLETHFYNSFRNKIRYLLNDYANKEVREKIIAILNNPEFLYKIKLKKLDVLLKFLLRNSVSFDEVTEDSLSAIRKQSTFIRNLNNNALCLTKSNKLCIPKMNLINSEVANENIYFTRIADELVRYKRVRLFMLEAKKYFNVTASDYLINNDEIILLQSLIFGDYFDDLISFDMNEYIQNVTYDVANPRIVTEKFSNEVSLNEQFFINDSISDFQMFSSECADKTVSLTNNNGIRNWKNILPIQSKETIVRDSYLCSYFVIVYVIKKLYDRDESVDSIKALLWSGYKDIFNTHKVKILEILKKQGKRDLVDAINKNKYDFETAIMSEGYFMTSLDIWVLAKRINLPIVLFSYENLMTGRDILVCGGDINKDRYFFIRCENESFRIITPSIELSKLSIDNIKQYDVSLDTFFENVRVTISMAVT
jgi:hypothetical protein